MGIPIGIPGGIMPGLGGMPGGIIPGGGMPGGGMPGRGGILTGGGPDATHNRQIHNGMSNAGCTPLTNQNDLFMP